MSQDYYSTNKCMGGNKDVLHSQQHASHYDPSHNFSGNISVASDTSQAHVDAVHDLGFCKSSTWHVSLLAFLHGCQLTHLRVVHTWDLLAIHTVRVAVVASTVGGGARQGPLSGDTPTHRLVQQGAAVVKQVLGLPVLWPTSFRVLDCLYAAASMYQQPAQEQLDMSACLQFSKQRKEHNRLWSAHQACPSKQAL